ncbi:MAG: lycopene cyclase family protein [Cyanophyceae cyanobacterium]
MGDRAGVGRDLEARRWYPWLAQIPGDPLAGLGRADRQWRQWCQGPRSVPEVVRDRPEPLGATDWDVIICGGTLGIFVGVALARARWRVAIVERGALRGREQEWNIARAELRSLLDLNLLEPADLEAAIAREFNPVRVQFAGFEPVWVENILNLGVSPAKLIASLRREFLRHGGQLFEQTAVTAVTVHPDGIAIATQGSTGPAIAQGQGATGAYGRETAAIANPNPPQVLTSRLAIDAMGHFSPIAQQGRQGRTPDGVCLVVGTCASGFVANDTADLMVSTTGIADGRQAFWEAFPAGDRDRTTYRFAYCRPTPDAFTLHDLFKDYFQNLCDYQGLEDLEKLTYKRALFGFFPSYRDSPLRPFCDRLLALGDSSGLQSPLSFGGFGALLRHLPRLVAGLQDALAADCLDRGDLAYLLPYQPNLAVTWLFQQAMVVEPSPRDRHGNPDRINQLLGTVFAEMATGGDRVLRPFLQDAVQFGALTETLARITAAHPVLTTALLPQLGPVALARWLPHYGALAAYSAISHLAPTLRAIAAPLPLSPTQRYHLAQQLANWRYGAGHE